MNSTDTKQNGSNTLCEDRQKFDPKTIFINKVKNVRTKRSEGVKVSLYDFVTNLSNPAKENPSKNYRALPAGPDRDTIKQTKFEAVTISTGFDDQLTGVLAVDLDIKLNPGFTAAAMKELVSKDPFVMVAAYSVTDGLFLLIRYPVENDLKAVFRALQEYLQLQYGLNLDKLEDKERLRIDSFDQTPLKNWNSEIYTQTFQEVEKLKEKAPAKQKQDGDLILNKFSTDPGIAFNNSGLDGFVIINAAAEAKEYTVKKGRGKEKFIYDRAGGLRSIVAMDNEGIVKFAVKSATLIADFGKDSLNYFEFYKILTGFTDFEALKSLAVLGFGTFIEPQIVRQNGNETYSKTLDFLEPKDIRLNQLTGIAEIAGQPLNDTHTAQMLTELSLLSGKNQSKDILQTCSDVISNKNQFHPFLQFVKTLEDLPETDFSQSTELDKLIDCFESSTPKELIKIYLIRWMLGLFDLHLLQRMTKLVLILSGTQNSGKTSFAKNILTDSLKMYGKVIEFNQNKMTDSKIALCSILIAVFDEFEDVLTKSKSLSDFKNLTSSYDIFERRPYRRNHEQMFRAAIIMATTNEKSILNDSTGNTRFLTIDVKAFNLEKYFTVDLNLVWLEIYELHLKGETSILSESERALQTNENINFESEDFIVGLIENSFHEDENGFVNTTEILIELEKNTKQHISLKRIGCALRKMDIERVAKKVNGKVLKGYNLKFNYES